MRITTEKFTLVQSDLNERLQKLTDEGWNIISVQCLNSDGGILYYVCYGWLVTMSSKSKDK